MRFAAYAGDEYGPPGNQYQTKPGKRRSHVRHDRIRSRPAHSMPRLPHRRDRRGLHHGRRASGELQASRISSGGNCVAHARRNAKTVADRWGIPKVHASPKALIEDPDVEIVDIAFPPDQQPELIRHALQQKHVKAILAQKPLALDFATAKALAAEAKACWQSLVRQSEYALRSIDARAQANSRSRASGHARFSPRSRCGRFRIGSRSSPTTTG